MVVLIAAIAMISIRYYWDFEGRFASIRRVADGFYLFVSDASGRCLKSTVYKTFKSAKCALPRYGSAWREA